MPNLDLYYRRCVIGGGRSFLVVANDFASFGRAVKRKLVLEIVGAPHPRRARGARREKRPRLLASASPAARAAPPCDAGERRRRSWAEDF